MTKDQIFRLFSFSENHKARGSGLAPWPARLTTPPPRLADFGYSNEMFERDTVIPHKTPSVYVSKCSTCLGKYACETI